MGGRCIDQLAESVTHLITESVKSKKYEVMRLGYKRKKNAFQ